MLPNLLVVGAMRCGTTAVYRYLDEHPEIFMSVSKEPHFFAFEGSPPTYTGPGDQRLNERTLTDLADYASLFEGGERLPWRGEASAMYLYLPAALEGMKRHGVDARIVILLRDPAERAYSAFEYLRRQQREPLATLAEGLAAEDERRAANWSPMWHYRSAGYYAGQVSSYLAAFGPERVHVILQDELEADPAQTFGRLCRWLGVDPDADIDFGVHNQSGTPRSQVVQRLTTRAGPLRRRVKRMLPVRARRMLEGVRERNIIRPPGLPAATRAALVESYREDIERLESLIDRDLSAWKRPS